MTDDAQAIDIKRARRWPRWMAGAVLLLVIIMAIAWSQREPLARTYIDDYLENAEVEASYEITRFGLASQRIENLVLGDPDNPDLTAEWAEIHVRLGWGMPEVRRITAHGVRLNGRFVDGIVEFGQLDRLLPDPSGEPFTLPALDVTLSDAVVMLDTPHGTIAIAAMGSGPLRDGFAGFIAARGPSLEIEGCEANAVRLDAVVSIDDRRPSISGPIQADSVICAEGEMAVAQPQLLADATFSEGLDRWGGEARVTFAGLSQGDIRTGATDGQIVFDGEAGGRTNGTAALSSEAVQGGGFQAQQANFLGYYRYAADTGIAAFDGDTRLQGGRLDRSQIAGVTDALRGAEGTPVGPIGAAIARATEQAASRFDTSFSLTSAFGRGQGLVRVNDLTGRSQSGARFVVADGEGLRFAWSDVAQNQGLSFDGTMRLTGGGFPEMLVELEQQGNGQPIQGYAQIAPFTVDGARLALAPVNFSAAANGQTRIDTVMELSGPLGGGRVDRLRVPVNGVIGRGGSLRFGQGCVPVNWARMRIASLDIGPGQLPLCPVEGGALLRYDPGRGFGGGAQVASPRLRATLGGSPLLVTARTFRLPLSSASFSADTVSVRLGRAGVQSELDIADLRANFVSGGVDGRYIGAKGGLYSVPIRLSESAGDWRFIGGVLDVTGSANVTDTSPDRRFEPLLAQDMALHLENNLITMTANAAQPESRTALGTVNLFHDLNSGAGEAVLDTPRLAFNDTIQPTDLTQLVLGVIADVEGIVSGTGTIRWNPREVTSDGVYQMTDVDLAAPFGPVEGLSGEIRFSDLLGMNTQPGQIATIRELNPGVVVGNGIVRYQLLDTNRVRVEGARFPFAGGDIILEPTILDFRVDQERRMVFRVEGVDGFRFLESRGFENIIATGTFDGTLPMVFNQNGGRIEGGLLTSRTGGTFSYTGEISEIEMGVFSSLAFDALELIRYRELSIGFEGAIDGEMVTSVQFVGVSPNLANRGGIAGLFTSQIADIPIQFNITLNAPFNQMLYSMRLLDDPGFLVNQAIQARIRDIRAEQSVQPPESDDLP